MKLGIIGDWSEEGFRYVKEKGLECIEFCVNHNIDSADFAALVPSINKWQAEFGVKVLSMGRWGMDRIDDNGAPIPEALNHDCTLIDAASALGCPVYNVGCNYIETKNYLENCEFAIGYFSKLLNYAEGKGVKISTYNCDWSNFVFDDRAWSIIMPALPALGIKYDVSHCRGRHGDYLKEIRDWGDRFNHFHLKGTLYIDGKGYDDPPAGLDQTDWRSVFALLYIKEYKGMVSIEPHSSHWHGAKGEWGVDFTINFAKPFIYDGEY